MGLGVVFATTLMLALPFVGGAGPSLIAPAYAAESVDRPIAASSLVASKGTVLADTSVILPAPGTPGPVSKPVLSDTDAEHVAQKPVPKPLPAVTAAGISSGTLERRAALAALGKSCPPNVGGSTPGAPAKTSSKGVGGTTSADLNAFAVTYNSIRVANCLQPVAMSHFRYDSCMEKRLFWMAEDPSTDPASAWGHIGSKRSDGVPSVGCDGNLAGGSGNSGATVATKWWNSSSHRKSLYRPSYTGGMSGVCIYFAMTHGGVPNEPASFTRAAAKWGTC